MNFMKILIRVAGIYNASAVIVFLTPGALAIAGVEHPYSPFWVWLPALLGLFAGLVLFISSGDLHKYGVFPYWNGIIRLVFATCTFAIGFGDTMGPFATLLAIGDIPLGLICVFGLPRVLNKSHLQLLINK